MRVNEQEFRVLNTDDFINVLNTLDKQSDKNIACSKREHSIVMDVINQEVREQIVFLSYNPSLEDSQHQEEKNPRLLSIFSYNYGQLYVVEDSTLTMQDMDDPIIKQHHKIVNKCE